MKTMTTPYDEAAHLRTPKEMASYLEPYIEKAEIDAALIAKVLGAIALA